MLKVEYADLLEEMHYLNAMLSVCQGSTQADIPDMVALDITLFCLHTKYTQLYEKLLKYREEGTAV